MIQLSMVCRADNDQLVYPVPCQEEINGSDPIPDSFSVSYPILDKALALVSGPTVKFGVNPTGKRGLLHYSEKRGVDSYTMVIIWLKGLG